MKLTIGKRIILGFVAAVLITAGIGTFAYSRFIAVDAQAKIIDSDCLPGEALAGSIEVFVRENYSLALRHLLADDKAEIDRVEADQQTLRESVNKALKDYQGTINDDADQKCFDAIAPARAAFSAVRDRVFALSRENKKKEAAALVQSELVPAYEKYAEAAQALAKFNNQTGDEIGDQINQTVTSAKRMILISVGL